MLPNHLARCFTYDAWANRRILEALKTIAYLEERPLKIMAHMLLAQKLWLKRMRGEDVSGLKIWPELKVESWEPLLEENAQGYQQFLALIPPERLTESITYRTSTGLDFRTPVADILTQVLLHGSYHRGQLAIAIKEHGGEPPMTDYVVFLREL